jgi:hypothetical protein
MEYVFHSFFFSITKPLPVPGIMVAWGIIMTLMCLVNSFAGLTVYVLFRVCCDLALLKFCSARLFLGLSESGYALTSLHAFASLTLVVVCFPAYRTG